MLIKYKLFPSTLVSPNVAFTFELLDIYTELLLQVHIPYLSFCQVLDALHSSLNINKVSSIYFSLIFIPIFNLNSEQYHLILQLP